MTDTTSMTGQELKVELDKLRPQIKDIKQQINNPSDDTETEDLNGRLTVLQTRKNTLREAFNVTYTKEVSKQRTLMDNVTTMTETVNRLNSKEKMEQQLLRDNITSITSLRETVGSLGLTTAYVKTEEDSDTQGTTGGTREGQTPTAVASSNPSEQQLLEEKDKDKTQIRDADREYGDSGFDLNVTAPEYVNGHDFNHFCNRYMDYLQIQRVGGSSSHFSLLLDEKTYKELAATKDSLTTIQSRSAKLFVPIFKKAMYPEGQSIVWKAKMKRMSQDPGEKIGDYAARIREYADLAYGNNSGLEKSEMCCVTLIGGIRDMETWARLVESGITSFEEALRVAKKHEAIREAMEKQIDVEEIDVLRVKTGGQTRQTNVPTGSEHAERQNSNWLGYDRQRTGNGAEQRRGGGNRTNFQTPVDNHNQYRLNNQGAGYGNDQQQWNRGGSGSNGYRNRDNDRSYNTNGYRGDSKVTVCYRCRREGHIARMCGFNTLSDGSPLNLKGVALQGSSATQVIQRETRRSRPTTATVNAIGEKVIVRGECAGVRASIFIDTGSGVSLITTEFVIRNGLTDRLEKCETRLRSFTNDVISVKGSIILGVDLTGYDLTHTFIVTDNMETDLLIGADFLKDHNLNLCMGQGRVVAHDGGYVDFWRTPEPVKKMRKVRIRKTVRVPPNSVMYVNGSIQDEGMKRGGSYSGVLEQSHRLLDTGFEVTESAVYSEGNTVPVQCTNYLERPFILYKNQVVACILPLDCGWQSSSSVSGVREVRPEEDGGHHDTTNHRTEHVTDYGQERTDDQEGPWTKCRLFEELRIDSIDVTTEEKEQLRDIVWRNKEVFSRNKHDIGKCNLYEATIQLKENHNAKWVPWRPTPYRKRAALNGHLEELLKAGVVEDCTSRSNWQSPVFLVEKPGKVNDYRWVLDARNINLQSIPDGYELPNINHVVDKIGGCKFFSTFDLSQSFHQISLDEQSRPITAFNVNGRRLQYKTMIMGHCSSAQQFSRCMSKILDRMTVEQLVAFLDDLLLGSKDISTHLERLERVLEGFVNANMKLSPGKCHFLRTEVNYVGLKISEEGLSITEDRVKVVKELRAPDSVKSLQSLTGFLNYNRKFIKNFAAKAAPLYEVLKQSNNRQRDNRRGRPRFIWTKEAGDSLEILKKDIANAITLCIPDVDDPLDSYEVILDGSNKGLGAELTQIVGGRRRTIGYFSKKVEKHKRERSQTKLEFLAMVEALTHWRVYLLGTRTFRIITDCEGLLTYETTLFSKPGAFMTRQLSKISGFNASISHISGKENNTADFLSRYPYRNTEKECGTQTDLHDVRVGLITEYNFGYGSYERDTDWDNIPFRRLGGKGGTERTTSTQTEIEDDRVHLISTEDTTRVRGHEHGAPKKVPSWILAGRAAEGARERTRGTAHTTEESKEHDGEEVCEELRRLERRRYHLDQALRAPKVKYAARKRLQGQIRGLESELEEKMREYETQETDGRTEAISSIRINDQAETEQMERGDKHMEMGTTDPTTTQYRLDLEELLKDKTLTDDDLKIDGMLKLRKKYHEGRFPDPSQVMFDDLDGDCECSQEHHGVSAVKVDTTRQTLTKEGILQCQEEDPILKEVKDWVRKEERPVSLQVIGAPKELLSLYKQFKRLLIEDDLLKKRWTDQKSEEERNLVIIPERMREEVMRTAHSSLLTAHPGVDKTIDVCLRQYYWPGMREEVKLYIGACLTCAGIKQPQAYLRAPLKHMIYHNFNDAVSIDHIVPKLEGRTADGNRYILSITDMWSGFVVAIPCKTQSAEESIRLIMRHYVLIHGVPKMLHSDNAKCFVSTFFTAVCRAFGCKTVTGLP